MAKQVVGLFHTLREAEAAVHDLRDLGIRNTDISLVGSNARGEYDETGTSAGGTAGTGTSEADTGAGVGAAGGAVVGGLAGVLVGLGVLAIPGIGPVLAAGPLAAAIGTTGAAVGAGALGAGIGAAAGGLLGALVGAGIPEEDANVYAESVRRGGALVIARVDDMQLDAAMDVMERHDVVDIDERSRELRAGGWSRYDENAGPYDLSTTSTASGRERGKAGTVGGRRTTRRTRAYAYPSGREATSGGPVDSPTSRRDSTVERGLGADLDRDRDVGVRDTRDKY